MSDIIKRFLSKVKKSDNECWIWTGAINPNGYGIFNYDGTHNKLAHIVSYTLFIGDIPSDMKVNQTCTNLSCVNPLHLKINLRKTFTNEKRLEYHKEYYETPYWKEYYRKQSIENRTILKTQAINALGGKCVQCGCTDIRCLEIDHIIPIHSNDSLHHGTSLWRRLRNGEIIENIQVLCACCHAIKTWENGDRRRY